jgi:hypothetical protein
MRRSIKLTVLAGLFGIAGVIGLLNSHTLAEAPGTSSTGVEFAAKDGKPEAEGPAPKVTFMDTTKHHLSEEIFGTWKVEAELTKRINGSYSGCDIIARIPAADLVKTRFTFAKDDDATKKFETTINALLESAWKSQRSENADSDSKSARQIEAFAKVWATGRYDFGDIPSGKGVFGLFVGRGMQTIFYIADSDEGHPNMEATLIQIARDPKGDKDILVYGGEFPSDPCGFMVRDIEAAKPGENAKGDAPADKPAEKPADQPSEAKPAPAK